MKPTLCHSCYTQTFYSNTHHRMICQCVIERERQAEQASKDSNQCTVFDVDGRESAFLQRCLEAYRSVDDVTISIDGMSRMVNITPHRVNTYNRYPSTKTHPVMSALAGSIADFSEAKRAAFQPLRKRRG